MKFADNTAVIGLILQAGGGGSITLVQGQQPHPQHPEDQGDCCGFLQDCSPSTLN